jgi:hypothetical protein
VAKPIRNDSLQTLSTMPIAAIEFHDPIAACPRSSPHRIARLTRVNPKDILRPWPTTDSSSHPLASAHASIGIGIRHQLSQFHYRSHQQGAPQSGTRQPIQEAPCGRAKHRRPAGPSTSRYGSKPPTARWPSTTKKTVHPSEPGRTYRFNRIPKRFAWILINGTATAEP